MSRASCLFVLFLVFNIAVKFGDCQDDELNRSNEQNHSNEVKDSRESNPICTEESKPGVDGCKMSNIESLVDKFERANIFGKSKSATKQNCSFSQKLKPWEEKLKQQFVIAPGTKWCGAGDKAKNESDLGVFNGTDCCCREHDMCKSNLVAGETKANLCNTGTFTRSSCYCDNKFYNCLKNVTGLIDSMKPVSTCIGHLYFNMLKTQCFTCVCPTDGCDPKTEKDECEGQCKKYKWVDARKY